MKREKKESPTRTMKWRDRKVLKKDVDRLKKQKKTKKKLSVKTEERFFRPMRTPRRGNRDLNEPTLFPRTKKTPLKCTVAHRFNIVDASAMPLKACKPRRQVAKPSRLSRVFECDSCTIKTTFPTCEYFDLTLII